MRFIHTTTHPFVSRAVEADIEVIDDLQGEAQEIAQAGNTFVTYGPPMQLARVRLYSEDLSSILHLNAPSFALGVWYDGPNL